MIGAKFLQSLLPSSQARRQSKPLVKICIDVFNPKGERAVVIEANGNRPD